MSVTLYLCGCAIVRSMYGEHEVIAIELCDEHRHDAKVSALIKQTAEALAALVCEDEEV